MSRLVDDPGIVGPGSYQLDSAFKKSPKAVDNWDRSRSYRNDQHKSQTQSHVGPGSYNGIKNYDTHQQTMTIARAGRSK